MSCRLWFFICLDSDQAVASFFPHLGQTNFFPAKSTASENFGCTSTHVQQVIPFALFHSLQAVSVYIYRKTLLPSATKLRRLCFYTRLSFCSQGRGSASVHAGIPTPREAPPPGSTPLPEMADAADGTHPTGMHSYLKYTFETIRNKIVS